MWRTPSQEPIRSLQDATLTNSTWDGTRPWSEDGYACSPTRTERSVRWFTAWRPNRSIVVWASGWRPRGIFTIFRWSSTTSTCPTIGSSTPGSNFPSGRTGVTSPVGPFRFTSVPTSARMHCSRSRGHFRRRTPEAPIR